VLSEVFLAAERAGTFEYQVHSEIPPRQFGRVAPGEHRDLPAADEQRVTACSDGHLPASVHGVVPEQVSQVVRRYEVVDRDHLRAVSLVDDLECRTADTPEAVDGDARYGASPDDPARLFPRS
jgi:hypothetical protein